MDFGAKIAKLTEKLDRLGLWNLKYNQWAMLPLGSPMPCFCVVESRPAPALKARVRFIEGWQNFHDFNFWVRNRDFGFVTSDLEFPALAVNLRNDGGVDVFRTVAGFWPIPLDEKTGNLVCDLLWEVYGVMIRLDGEPELVLKYINDGKLFSRRQLAVGKWEDAPLAIVAPRPHKETVVISKDDIAKAKDLPLLKDKTVELAFGRNPGLRTSDDPSRMVYELKCVDAATEENLFCFRSTVNPPERRLEDLWQDIAAKTLKSFITLAYVPGTVKVGNGRMFRMLRILTMEIPFKLSLHDRLDHLR